MQDLEEGRLKVPNKPTTAEDLEARDRPAQPVFSVGERFRLRGVVFRIQSIGDQLITARPIPARKLKKAAR